MAKLLVEDTSLTSVADAIRTKGGTSERLVFPEGFNTAIANIPSGGASDYFVSDAGSYFSIGDLIKELPLTNCSGLSSLNRGFYFLKNIEKISLANTENVTDWFQTFGRCRKLKEVVGVNLKSATNITGLFADDVALISAPNTTLGNATSVEEMFSGCTALKNVPNYDTSKITNFIRFFYHCESLETLPMFNASLAESVDGVIDSCQSLVNFGGFKDLGKAYNPANGEKYYYYELALDNTDNLSHDSLMNVINNLYDLKTAGIPIQTLRLGYDNKQKLTAEEMAIATNKGWFIPS